MNANQVSLQLAAQRANAQCHISSGQAAAQPTINSILGGSYWTGVGNSPATVVTPRKDPFVLASEIAASQPKDKAWRLFQGSLFRTEDVMAVTPSPQGMNDDEIIVRFRAKNGEALSEWMKSFLLPIDVPDKTKWFAEHVLGFEFNNSP